jgi:hypothetical protein
MASVSSGHLLRKAFHNLMEPNLALSPERYPAFSATTTQSIRRQHELEIWLQGNVNERTHVGPVFHVRRIAWKKSSGLVADLEEAGERLGERRAF